MEKGAVVLLDLVLVMAIKMETEKEEVTHIIEETGMAVAIKMAKAYHSIKANNV